MKARVEYRRPTTALSIELERRREASDGTMPYATWRTGIHLLNSSDGVHTHGMSLYRSDNTNQRGRRTKDQDDDQRRLMANERTNSRYIAAGRSQRSGSRWGRGGRSVDEGPSHDTIFATPQREDTATLLPSMAEFKKWKYDANNHLVNNWSQSVSCVRHHAY